MKRVLRVLCASIALLALFLAVSAGITTPAHAATRMPASYACGTPNSNNHCYGDVLWNGTNSGLSTELFTNQFFAGDCFINEEAWDSYYGPNNTNYWVEAGIESSATNVDEYLFWADDRPNLGYAQHNGEVLQTADFGKNATIEIFHDSTSTFTVGITGLPDSYLAGESKQNSIVPNYMILGMELCGSSGVYSPKNGFSHNQYKDAHTGNYTYQSNDGSVPTPTYPANGYWTIYPTQSNTGGQFTVCIQDNGC